jgi:hypothetical protein
MLKAIKKPTQLHPETSGFNCVGLLVNGSPGFWPDYPLFSHPNDFDDLPGANLFDAPQAVHFRLSERKRRRDSESATIRWNDDRRIASDAKLIVVEESAHCYPLVAALWWSHARANASPTVSSRVTTHIATDWTSLQHMLMHPHRALIMNPGKNGPGPAATCFGRI